MADEVQVATSTAPILFSQLNFGGGYSGSCVNESQIDSYFNIYFQNTNTLVASTTHGNIGCSFSNPPYEFPLNVPISIHANVAYRLELVKSNPTAGFTNGTPVLGVGNGSGLASITWNNPTNGEILNGWPSSLNFNVVANANFGGYITGYVNGDQGQTIGSFFPAGTTPFNYPTPSFATTSLSWAHICIGAGSDCEIASSTISFTPASTITIDTGTGIGPVYPSPIDTTATSSPFYVDCSAYSISLFSSSTLAGIGCVAKKTALDVVAILFIPNEATLNGYATLSLNDKFPFAYWYDLKSSFEAENASSTGAFPSLSIKFKNVNGTTTTLAVFSSSSISTYIGSSNISLFRTLMQGALWLAFAYFIYRKIKDIFNVENTSS